MDVQDGFPPDGGDEEGPPGPAETRPPTAAGAPQTGPGRGSDEPPPGTMTVEVDGRTRRLPAERDYTGDGRPDAATETPDGRVIVFADTTDNATGADRPDGRADEAYVVDKRTGRVVGAAHVDPRTGEWVDGPDPAAAVPPAGAAPAAVPDPEAGR